MRIPGLSLDGPLDELPWRATSEHGVAWIDLAGDPSDDTAGGASMTVLIRMEPGCGYPRHRHVGAEDVLVLAGGYEDDDGRRVGTGDFVRYPAGSCHAPCAFGDAGRPVGEDNPACVLFAVAHGGTERVRGEGSEADGHKTTPSNGGARSSGSAQAEDGER